MSNPVFCTEYAKAKQNQAGEIYCRGEEQASSIQIGQASHQIREKCMVGMVAEEKALMLFFLRPDTPPPQIYFPPKPIKLYSPPLPPRTFTFILFLVMSKTSSEPNTAQWPISLSILYLAIRISISNLSPLMDCDEVYNYWEPLHFVLYGRCVCIMYVKMVLQHH